ncbi:MAG: anthranilate synthase component I [Leptospirillia bacterium]
MNFTVPDFDTFKALAGSGNLIPVYREIMADLDTPVTAFMKLSEGENSFLLESVAGGERWARYSFIGWDPRVVIRSEAGRVSCTRDGEVTELPHDGNPLMAVRDYMKRFTPVTVEGLPPFTGGAVGFLAYDMVRFFDDIPVDLAGKEKPGLGWDDFCFLITDRMVVVDNARQVIQVVVNVHTDESSDLKAAYDAAIKEIDSTVERLRQPRPVREVKAPGPPSGVESNLTRERYLEMVETAKEYIRAGDIFQVVLSQRFHTPLGCEPLDLYRALRRINPSPYMYFLKLGERYVVGASPEILVRTVGGKVALRPIAGTRPRGGDPEEDRRLEKELHADEKECAEHLMLVDLARNDVGRVATTGSVKVDDFMVTERYSHVMHIVSHVSGELSEAHDAYDVLVSCFPAGTLSGAPKIRAMQIIEELEPSPRGLYGGAVGYFGFDGSSDMAINIRTVMVESGVAYLQAGAGIVADSDPQSEFEESEAKARAVVRAIALAQQGLDT